VKRSGIIEIETFLIDFSGDIYGDDLQVELLRYLREEKMFASVNELIDAMQRDLIRARALIAEETA
jgi:riboflavin kinase/FMN adenylyltransferase